MKTLATARAAAENDSRGAQRTNVKPYTLNTKAQGPVRIDPSDQNLGRWYLNMRYIYDLGFTGRFKHINVEAPDLAVQLDLDMTAVNAPMLTYSMPYTGASAAGKVTPGQAGASVVPNTIVDWMTPRMGDGKISVPDFKVRFVQ